MDESRDITIGVVADTHVPDRAHSLDPTITTILREAGVVAVLHAGDVCSPLVLDLLGTIAPVYAVRGNRDVWQLAQLPIKRSISFAGVNIGLIHGHGDFFGYMSQKLSYLFRGYQFLYYQKRLRREFPDARVVVFGHTHRCENRWADGLLMFNPGPASRLSWGIIQPSIGLLIPLDGGQMKENN